MSQVTKQIAADAKVRVRMEKLLQWATDQLNECEYEQGIDWLDRTFGKADGPDGVNVLRRKLEGAKGFWAWWKNQWALLDAQLNPNLRAAQVGGEWLLGYHAPNVGPTYFRTLGLWQDFYQGRHIQTMQALRPDDDTLRRILKATE